MKKYILHTLLIIASGLQAFAQAPTLSWQKNIGGTGDDFDLISTQNFQGDIFIAGTTYSNNTGDIPATNGLSDIYVAKLTANGNNIAWSHTFGGTGDDIPADIAATNDGGLIILCYVDSTTGDFNQAGVWLLKLNNDGSTGFKTFYTGGNPDLNGSVIQTADGGYIFHSTKTVSGKGLDSWVVKTNSAGILTWSQTNGGTADEYAADILEYDGNYYVLGESKSTTVNSQTNNGLSDLLLLKINSNGSSTLWTKLLGGSGNDGGVKLVLDENNNLLVLGSYSTPSNGVDMWLLSRDPSDGSNFSGSYFFGNQEDDFPSGIYFNESSFQPIVVGETFSDWLAGPDPDTSNILVAEVLSIGGTQWTNILGGSGFESPASITGTIDGGLLISGHSYSNDGDLTGNNGGADFWLIKLAYPCPDELTLNAANFSKSLSRTAESSINTNSKYNGSLTKVKLKSSYIQMNEGFEVEAGTVFETEIGGCPP